MPDPGVQAADARRVGREPRDALARRGSVCAEAELAFRAVAAGEDAGGVGDEDAEVPAGGDERPGAAAGGQRDAAEGVERCGCVRETLEVRVVAAGEEVAGGGGEHQCVVAARDDLVRGCERECGRGDAARRGVHVGFVAEGQLAAAVGAEGVEHWWSRRASRRAGGRRVADASG